MIGKYKIIGGIGYLQINKSGTLIKMPKTTWIKELFLLIKSHFVDLSDTYVINFLKKNKRGLNENNNS